MKFEETMLSGYIDGELTDEERGVVERRLIESPKDRELLKSLTELHQKLIAMPEGLIDPWMKTVAFYNGERKLASCHYYATHPMSYYGDGRVTSDFAGLARKQRQQDEPDCLHLYFTGCAGNISAGSRRPSRSGRSRFSRSKR